MPSPNTSYRGILGKFAWTICPGIRRFLLLLSHHPFSEPSQHGPPMSADINFNLQVSHMLKKLSAHHRCWYQWQLNSLLQEILPLISVNQAGSHSCCGKLFCIKLHQNSCWVSYSKCSPVQPGHRDIWVSTRIFQSQFQQNTEKSGSKIVNIISTERCQQGHAKSINKTQHLRCHTNHAGLLKREVI